MTQRDLQLNIRIPDIYYAKVPRLSAALTGSIDFLVSNVIPFRLFYNYTKPKNAALAFKPSRHVQNQVVWLVFVIVEVKSEAISLSEVVRSCTLGMGIGLSFVVHKDWIQLVVDTSGVVIRGATYYRDINRVYVPLNMIALYWTSSGFSPSGTLIRETCSCDDLPNFTPLRKILSTVKEQNGLRKVTNLIRNTKMNFRGRRILISPTKVLKLGWDTGLRLFFSPFIFRKVHESWREALVGLFHPFTTLHNFTFDFKPPRHYNEGPDIDKKNVGFGMKEAIILNPAPFEESYMYPLSLFDYSYWRTLFFRKTTTLDPSGLSSLLSPFSERAAALILLSLSVCAAMILLLLSVNSRGVATAAFMTFSGLIGKTVNLSGSSRPLLWFYTMWLFLVSFVAMTYTNILQSIVVVPGFRSNGLTFQEMLASNFTFKSNGSKWMRSAADRLNATRRNVGQMNKTTSILDQEKTLAKLVMNLDWSRFSSLMTLVESSAEASKSAVLVGSETENEYEKMGRILGLDAIIGQERFFSFLYWWSFGEVERGSLLAKSVELLKQFGFVTYFLQLSQYKAEEQVQARAQEDFIESKRMCGMPENDVSSVEFSLPLSDSLITESFLLLLYGISIATVACMGEMFTRILVNFLRRGT